MHFVYKQLEKQKLNTLTIKDFIDRYHTGLTTESVRVAISKDKIDHHRPGKEYFVVLTKKTISYTPNKSKKRNNE